MQFGQNDEDEDHVYVQVKVAILGKANEIDWITSQNIVMLVSDVPHIQTYTSVLNDLSTLWKTMVKKSSGNITWVS